MDFLFEKTFFSTIGKQAWHVFVFWSLQCQIF